MSDSLRPHGLQHTRFPCPLPTPRIVKNHVHSKGYVFIFKNGSFKPKHKFLTKLFRAFCCKYVDFYPKFLLSLSLHHVFNFMSSLLLPWVMLPPPKVSMPTRFLRQKNGKLWQNPSWMIANGNSAPEETWTTVLYSFFEG